MNILNFFISRTKLVNMLTIGILLVGVLSLGRIKREAFPKVDFDVVFVVTIYPGAAPEDVELNVTIPIEDRIRGVSGIDKVESVSREGYSSVQVTLDPDVLDKEKVKQDIQKAVDQVIDLPPEVENRPVIWELKTDNFGVIQVSLSSADLSEQEVRRFGRALKKKLESLPTVARVDTLGFRQREIQILVDLAKLPFNYLSLGDIVNFIRARNVRIPAGTIRGQGEAKSVVTEAKFQTLQDVENMILRTNFEGQRVRVKDVARVEDGFEEYRDLIKMNGSLGVTLEIIKKVNADALRTIDQVKAAVDDFKTGAPETLRINFINDTSRATRSILGIVTLNAAFGMILVVAVLLLFLNLRTAFWTAVGIPLSLFLTLFVMLVFDVSLSGNSMLGMIIVLGMLVDDAIVVAESIYRYRLQGLSAYEAAKEGLRVVALPVLVTVVTTIIAFAPLFLLPGIPGKFVLPVPLVITFALMASLFESYFILPNHLTGHVQKSQAAGEAAALKERRWFPALREGYGRLLDLALHHRLILVMLFIVFFVGSVVFAVVKMKFVLFPTRSIEQVTCFIEADRETSLVKMDELTRRVEDVLKAQPQGAISSFTTQIARGRWEIPDNENVATMTVNFPPAAEQTHDPNQVIQAMKDAMAAIPEFIKTRFEIAQGGPPVGGDVEVKIIGNDNAQRAEIVGKIKAFLASLAGVADVESSDKTGKPEFALEFDFEKLARFGLSAQDVGLTVRTAIEGSIVSRTYTPDERIDYRVLLRPQDRKSLDTIRQLHVTNQQRNLVPITEVVNLREKETVAKLDHLNGDRVTTIQTNLDKQRVTPLEVSGKLAAFIPGLLKAYPGFRYELGGEAKESQKFIVEISIAFLVAILAIYFILALLFNSFLQPFIVILAIPFGIVGVIWIFFLHGLDFSFLTMIGVVGLSGVVVNDSLIMVDYINHLIREKGCHSFEDYLRAVVEGARTRLRPILLTSLTTIAGVMPTAYGLGGYVEAIAPMVLAIGWGIIFASTLTLFLLPGLYLLEVQFEMRLAGWFPWLPLKTQCADPFAGVEKPRSRRRKA
ncbi:MAG: efflux RND transporter permease subunit [candidate division FCPU426 bacterium]